MEWLVKFHLIIRLRRSGVNGLTLVSQRSILPQVTDLCVSIVDLLLASDGSVLSDIDLGNIDFTLAQPEQEKRHLASQAHNVWYTNRDIPFGLALASLLWKARFSSPL